MLPLVARGGSVSARPVMACCSGASGSAPAVQAGARRLAPRGIYALACLVIAGAAVLAVTHSVAVAGRRAGPRPARRGSPAWGCSARPTRRAPDLGQGPRPLLLSGRVPGANGIGALVLGGVARCVLRRPVRGRRDARAGGGRHVAVGASGVRGRCGHVRTAAAATGAGGHGGRARPDHGDLRPGNGRSPAISRSCRQAAPRPAPDGATHWHLHRADRSDRDVFEEMFVVGSWEERERQHQRGGRDRAILDDIDGLRRGTHRTARHALGVRPPRSRKR